MLSNAFTRRQDMKKVFGALAIAAVLASCNLIKTGPIDVTPSTKDPIGLQNKAVTVSLLGQGVVRTQASGDFSFTGGAFDDSADIKKYIDNLKGWAITQSFNGTAKVALKTAGTCPATVNLTGITATVSLKSGTNTADAAVTSNNPNLALTRTGSSCDYTFNTALLIFSINYDEAAITNKVKPLLIDGAPNTASGTLKFTSNELVAGDTITLTWGDGTASIVAGL
jgi:hypothetical protein